MKMSPKAQASLDKVIRRFESGDLSPLVAVVGLRRDPPLPFDRWSYRNRVIAYAQTDRTDLRGFRQWKDADRYVKKGARAAFILRPMLVPPKDDEEAAPRLVGFRAVPVFSDDATDGPGDLPAETHTPPQLPPLWDLAARLGIETEYTPGIPDALGDANGTRIHLNSADVAVWFHELAHALHTRLDNGARKGSTEEREAIAEFTAAVLMELYDLGDRSGNAWRYIRQYHKDPLRAVYDALGTVERILAYLEETKEEMER